jgi:lysophospholipase L1-like esterase
MSIRKKLLFVFILWGVLDLSGGAVVAWKNTRTEAWVRTKDPVTHHGFRALESQPEEYGPFRWMMYINSLGGKDASCRKVAKVGDRPRIAIFGDSFAEGWGLPYEQGLPAHLQNEIGSKGIEVLGFGVASYCPSLTEKWMRKLVDSGVRWNMALVLIDAGDAWEETHDYKDFIEGRQKMRPSNKPQFLRLKWYEYSLTVQTVTALHRLLFPKKRTLSDWEMAQEGNNWKLQWLQKPEAKNWLRDGLAQEGQAVGRILQMGKEHGFSVLLVIYPYPVMMAHSWLDNEHTKFWKEFASKNSVALADLSSEFVEKGAKPEETYKKYFIPGDFHWNNEGNNLVAKALVSRIMEKITSP